MLGGARSAARGRRPRPAGPGAAAARGGGGVLSKRCCSSRRAASSSPSPLPSHTTKICRGEREEGQGRQRRQRRRRRRQAHGARPPRSAGAGGRGRSYSPPSWLWAAARRGLSAEAWRRHARGRELARHSVFPTTGAFIHPPTVGEVLLAGGLGSLPVVPE